MSPRAQILLGVALVAAVVAIVFREQFAAVSGDRIAAIVLMVMSLALVAGGLAQRERAGLAKNWLGMGLVWACILVGVAVAYQALSPLLPPDFGRR